MTDSHVVIVDPQARAEWGRESLLVRTRPSEDGRYRSALMRPSYCCVEACHCTEVKFEVSLIDEPLAGVNEDDARVQRALDDSAAEPEPMILRFELQLGKFTSVGRPASEPSDELDSEDPDILRRGAGVSDEVAAWVHALERCFDGEMLEELWNRHLLSRGLDPRQMRRRPPDAYDGGLLAWTDVCPTARRDVYFVQADDTMTSTYEDYCPNPACTCTEAHVTFARVEGSIGTVTVNFETDELRMVEYEGWSREELEAAWAQYVERWPNYRGRLRERHSRLRAALHNAMRRKIADYSTVTTPRRGEPKVGRNAPCPCGSGRKYKRCCGGNRASP